MNRLRGLIGLSISIFFLGGCTTSIENEPRYLLDHANSIIASKEEDNARLRKKIEAIETLDTMHVRTQAIALFPNTETGTLSKSQSEIPDLSGVGDTVSMHRFQCPDSKNIGKNTITAECNSETSSNPRLIIKKNGEIQDEYSYVEDGALSSNNKILALLNYEKDKDGVFIKQFRIIHNDHKESVRLPLRDCTEGVIGWGEEKLVTISLSDIYSMTRPRPNTSAVCVWSSNGKLLYTLEIRALSDRIRDIDIGFVPNTNIMYAIRSSWSEKQYGGDPDCELLAFDLKNLTAITIPFNAYQESASCPKNEIELDLRGFTINNPSFRFRTHHQKSDTTPAKTDEWRRWPATMQ